MNFTVTEITLLITTLLGAGGFLLQMRTTSFSQFVKINEMLTARIKNLEDAAEKKDKRIELLETDRDQKEVIINQMADDYTKLERQNVHYMQYITLLTGKMTDAGIPIPPPPFVL